MLIKKAAGNWHKIDIWESENLIVAYKAGGLVLKGLNSDFEIYIPFYDFADFQIKDSVLYVLDRSGSSFVLDRPDGILTPANIEYVTRQCPQLDFEKLDLIEEPRAWDLTDKYQIVAYKQKGIDFFDLHSGDKLFHFDFPGYSFLDDIKACGNMLYMADVFGLRILDFSNPETPTLNDSHIHKGWPKDIAVKDNYVFVADVLGIKIYDKALDFAMVGKYETNRNRVAKVLVKEDYAFLCCEARGLKILAISDISHLRPVAGILMDKGAWDLAEYGNALYLAAYTNGLKKIRINNIKQIETTFSYEDADEIIGVYADEKAVYAAASYEGLKILSHDLTPVSAIGINTGRCWSAVTCGNMLYTACGDAGILIHDISDIATPRQLNTIPIEQARDMVLREGKLYVANGRSGALIFDLSDPKEPSLIRCIPSATFTRGIMVDDEYIYKADGDGGLEVYSI